MQIPIVLVLFLLEHPYFQDVVRLGGGLRRSSCPTLYVAAAEAKARAVAEGGPEQLRVGLLAQGVFWKGLFRDVEIVTWGTLS